MNDPKKGGYTTLAPALDLTTSLRGDFPLTKLSPPKLSPPKLSPDEIPPPPCTLQALAATSVYLSPSVKVDFPTDQGQDSIPQPLVPCGQSPGNLSNTNSAEMTKTKPFAKKKDFLMALLRGGGGHFERRQTTTICVNFQTIFHSNQAHKHSRRRPTSHSQGSKMTRRDKQTGCRQQRNNIWLPPPLRMHEEQEVPQNCAKKCHGENFDTELKNEIVPDNCPP